MAGRLCCNKAAEVSRGHITEGIVTQSKGFKPHPKNEGNLCRAVSRCIKCCDLVLEGPAGCGVDGRRREDKLGSCCMCSPLPPSCPLWNSPCSSYTFIQLFFHTIKKASRLSQVVTRIFTINKSEMKICPNLLFP